MGLSWLRHKSFQSSIKASHLLLYVMFGIRPATPPIQDTDLLAEEEKFYALSLKPQAAALEEARKVKLRKFRILFYTWAALILALLYIADNFILPLIFGFLSYQLILMYLKSYQQNYKETVVQQILPYFDPTWQYSYDAVGVSTELLQSYFLLPKTDALHLEDHIKGRYQDLYFEMVELSATNLIRKQDDKLEEKEIFRGLSLILALRKPIDVRVFIVPNGEPIYNQPYAKIPRLLQVKLESPKFEKVFDVYATDQVKARYLLNPIQMEKILEIAQLFNNYKIKFSFNVDSFQVLLPQQGQHFEFNAIFHEVTLLPELKQLLKECKYIIQIAKLSL